VKVATSPSAGNGAEEGVEVVNLAADLAHRLSGKVRLGSLSTMSD
jgi:hypothetical protein